VGGELHLSRKSGVEGRGHLSHDIEQLLHLRDLLEVLDILRLVEVAEQLLNGVAVVHPLVKKGLGRDLGVLGSHGLLGRLAAGVRVGAVALTLASLGRLSGGRGGRWGAAGAARVVVHTLHVVLKVPLPGKSVSGNASLATIIVAEEGLVTMSMEPVGLPLMTK
jgi:hypothetical protein